MSEVSLGALAQPRREWAKWLGARLLNGLTLPLEAGVLTALGAVVGAIGRHAEHGLHLPNPIAMAAAYLVLVIIVNGGNPLHRLSYTKAIQALAATFVTGWFLQDDIGALPWMVVWFALACGAVGGWRRLAATAAQSLPDYAWPSRPAAFIGNSEAAERLFLEMQGAPRQRFNLVGFFDDRNSRAGPLHGRLPNLGEIDDIVAYIHEHDLRDVFMALPWSAGERIAVLIERLRFLPLTVHLIPDHMPLALRRFQPNWLEGVVMPTLMLPPFSNAGAFAKRSLDALVAGVLMILLAPLFAVVALAIRLDSRGPVFFRQQRTGQYGESFSILKFRSLHVASADTAAETLVQKGDQRVTRVGRPLRKFSIDELPQILNVLLGHMSLVGPRPHASRAKAGGRIYAEVMPDYMLRYRVKPGMTGWAQINGWRGNTDTEEKLRKRVEFDFAYIERWSFLLDLKILMMTVPSALFPPKENV
jgi:Undecaprenyl-phosphate glucose phosphotransferase